jgi:hypothetical protein
VAFCYADSTLHGLKCSFNNGTYVNMADATGIQNQSYIYAADAQANDSYAVTLSPAPSAYATGQHFTFKANTANTGAATLNVNSLGAKTIKKVAGGVTTDLSDNDIRSGQFVDVVYDGTNFQMQSTLGNAASGGSGGYTLFATSHGNTSPADATTYYIGWAASAGFQSSFYEAETQMIVPVAGTITAANWSVGYSDGIAGTNENVTIALCVGSTQGSDGSCTNLSTTDQWTDSKAHKRNVTGLSIAVSAGDFVIYKITTPTWATNPTTVSFSGVVFIQ